MILVVLNLCIFAVICLLVVLVVEWVAGQFGVPANILQVFRVLVALIVLAYAVGVLLGAAPLWRLRSLE